MGWNSWGHIIVEHAEGAFASAEAVLGTEHYHHHGADVHKVGLATSERTELDVWLWKRSPVKLAYDIYLRGAKRVVVAWGCVETSERGFAVLEGDEITHCASELWCGSSSSCNPITERWCSVFVKAAKRLATDPNALHKTLARIAAARGRAPKKRPIYQLLDSDLQQVRSLLRVRQLNRRVRQLNRTLAMMLQRNRSPAECGCLSPSDTLV